MECLIIIIRSLSSHSIITSHKPTIDAEVSKKICPAGEDDNGFVPDNVKRLTLLLMSKCKGDPEEEDNREAEEGGGQ